MSQTEITATERQVIAANTEQLHARIRHIERELTAERIAHKTQTNMAQRLFDNLSSIREGVEKLAAEYTRLADTSDDEDFITEKRALARELRALLK